MRMIGLALRGQRLNDGSAHQGAGVQDQGHRAIPKIVAPETLGTLR